MSHKIAGRAESFFPEPPERLKETTAAAPPPVSYPPGSGPAVIARVIEEYLAAELAYVRESLGPQPDPKEEKEKRDVHPSEHS